MTRTADILIVGGGILGTSLAYYLARKRVNGVVLLEKGAPGDGSTGKSAAIVRMHYTNEATVRLALRSRDLFLNWTDAVGGDSIYSQTGWFFLTPPEQESNLAENLAMNRATGVDAEQVELERLAAAVPGINLEGIGQVVYEARSGCADPNGACLGLAGHAAGQGVEVCSGQGAQRLLTAGDRVTGVETSDGVIEAGVTVLAAGPWSGNLARGIGLELPLELTREQELIVAPADKDAAPTMSISNMCDQIYLRPTSGGQLLLGRGYPKNYETVDVEDYKTSHDQEFCDDVLPRLEHRFPRLAGSTVERGVVGLYTVTPDWHPIVGPINERPGLWVATGGSGHAFKIGPAIGEMLADAIVDGSCDWIDSNLFAPDRFTAGHSFSSSYGGNRA
jgi:glycine/D-amino acid oxidase-like deaminating enzyme